MTQGLDLLTFVALLREEGSTMSVTPTIVQASGEVLYSKAWCELGLLSPFPYLQICIWGQWCLAGWYSAWGFTAVVSWAFVWIMKCFFLTAFWGWCFFPHFPDKKQVTLSPESPRKFTQELGSKLSQTFDPMLLITTHCSGLCSGAPHPNLLTEAT